MLNRIFHDNPSIVMPPRFFEPIIIYIRDDIAIPNIGVKKYKNYMSFLLELINLFFLSEEPTITSMLIPSLIYYPILIYYFSKKYNWENWSKKLFGKINISFI